MLKWAAASREHRAALWQMCARDILFWCNAFVFIFDPRKMLRLPFITYEYQDGVILEIQSAIGHHNLTIDKSRQLGVTWKLVACADHQFEFKNRPLSFLLTSHKEDKVDKTGKTDTLLGRVDFIREYLPEWIKAPADRVHLLHTNKRTRSVIAGEATTGKAGRSEVYTAVIPDEFAFVDPPIDSTLVSSIVPMTLSVIYTSTPNGVGNEFYRKRHQEGMKVVTLHWTIHPEYRRGLYHVQDGRITIIDKEYEYPPDYKFNQPFPDKFAQRSPWFDQKCLDLGSLRLILQELEITYHGSGSEVFNTEVLQDMLRKTVKPPYRRGRLGYNPQSLEPVEFIETHRGPLQFWCHFDKNLKVARPPSSYVVGVDISRGTGASMSCASVVDRRTGEKVASYKTASRSPNEFAEDVVALCKMFPDESGGSAFLIWDAMGPGQTFYSAVEKAKYTNVYYHRQEARVDKKIGGKPGYYMANAQLKNLIIDELDAAYSRGTFINRCKEDVESAFHYKLLAGNKIEHTGAISPDDPADAGVNHGDAVIADALANHVLEIYKSKLKAKVQKPKALPGSFAWRRKQRELAKAAKEEW